MLVTAILVMGGFIGVLLLIELLTIIRLILGKGASLSHIMLEGYLGLLIIVNFLQLYFLLRAMDFLDTQIERAIYLGAVVILLLVSKAITIYRIGRWMVLRMKEQ